MVGGRTQLGGEEVRLAVHWLAQYPERFRRHDPVAALGGDGLADGHGRVQIDQLPAVVEAYQVLRDARVRELDNKTRDSAPAA